MMPDLQSIHAVEPTGKIRFSSTRSLYEHVRKHLLDQRDEYWSQLIDADQLAEARREIRDCLPEKPMLRKTMGEYFRLLAHSLIRLTREGRQHWHLYCEPVRFSEDSKLLKSGSVELLDEATQTIELWDLEKKVLVIAKSFVKNGEFPPYVICSGYRLHPKLSGNSLRKNIERYLRDRQYIEKNRTVVIAMHDTK